ncbi:hypothetical protein [Paraburkholderia sp. BL21I4N1]|uniref:hypothetical protein n=1 Tax=Paraburkholderia sp. BL21I4N1 TaxID=1938801 RepID=UPI0011B22833|nr:hypothetical protein [Paraburkholderia sp. BL21I4N1]
MRDPRDGDIEAIAADLRSADIEEIHGATGHRDCLAVMRQGAQLSTLLWTIEVDGKPAGLFGVTAAPGIGVPWMLGTPALERAPKQLTRLGREYVHLMSDKYATLLNYVDARSLKSVQWLDRLGFTVQKETEPYGVFGLPFHRFGMKR